MHTQRPLLHAHGGLALDTPKTKGSVGSVGLTVKATEALIRYRERQAAEWQPVIGDALVFTNKAGESIHQTKFIRRSFKPLLKHAALPDTNWRGYTAYLYEPFTAGPCEPRIRSLADGMVISRVHVGELHEIPTGMGRRRSYGQAAS